MERTPDGRRDDETERDRIRAVRENAVGGISCGLRGGLYSEHIWEFDFHPSGKDL